MDGAIEMGTCEVCQKEGVILNRKYFNYPFICDCHSPNHFELVKYCNDCVPLSPDYTKVFVRPIEED